MGLVVFETEGNGLGDVLVFVLVLDEYLTFRCEPFNLQARTLSHKAISFFILRSTILSIIFYDLDQVYLIGLDFEGDIHYVVSKLGIVFVKVSLLKDVSLYRSEE